MRRRAKLGARLYLALVLLLMYLPVFVVILYSFNANAGRQPIAFTGFSLRNYAALFQDTRGLVESLKTSLVLALMTD